MNGAIVETKLGLAVEEYFHSEDGNTYIHRRLVNGANGTPIVGAEVRYSGHNTWDGIGFTVATDPLPHPDISEVSPTKKTRLPKSTR